MIEKTIPVTLGGVTKDIPFAYYEEDFEQYRPTWDKADVDEMWYEKLGFHARGFLWGKTIHLWKAIPDVIGHEILHVFDHHHPNTFLASVKHAFDCGFTWDAFTSVLRRKPDPPELRAISEMIAARLRLKHSEH